MIWDGEERRNGKSTDHDLLTRIDVNLSNFIKAFDNHIIDDDIRFNDLKEQLKENNKNIQFLNNRYWMIIGALILVEIILRFIK